LLLLLSCRVHPDSNRHYDDNREDRVYKLRLSPVPGEKWHFDITDESEVKITKSDEKKDNRNKAEIGVNYTAGKDSAGNITFTIRYDKIHVYSKKDDEESEMDAMNASTTTEPAERMLGTLLSATIVATFSPRGEVRRVSGYQEISDKIMAEFSRSDENTRQIVRQRLEKMVGNWIRDSRENCP
jgi:hypothetical protein